ncbi:MAG: hypothetical protein ACLT8H_03805 [Streptococcus parasanguinis]
MNNKTKFTGKVKAGEVGQGGKYIVAKSGWDVNKEHKQIGFRISVNRTGEAIPNAVITDTLKSTESLIRKVALKFIKGPLNTTTAGSSRTKRMSPMITPLTFQEIRFLSTLVACQKMITL